MIYITSSDNTARFALGNPGTTNLVVFGVNPSTATDIEYDRTIRRVEGYSRAHGFGGWLMLNLYPQRAKDPDDLHTEANTDLCAENIDAIAKALELVGDFTLCAAWGELIRERKYLASCLTQINASLCPKTWHSIGEPLKKGHPRHPLYAQTKWPLKPFDLTNYLLFQKL